MSNDERPPLISADAWAATPPPAQEAFWALVELVRTLTAEVTQLRAEVKDLRARLLQTSQNSSKPPSSDPPSAPPRPPTPPRGRKRDGQPGHVSHERLRAPEDQVDTIVPLYPTQCTWCRAIFPETLPDIAPVIRTQIWDLPKRLIHITEYQQHTVACPCCQTRQEPPLLTDLPPGAFGSGVIALTALLRQYRMSDREIIDFWQTVCGLRISLGSVVRACQHTSTVLELLHQAIQTHILAQPAIHASWQNQIPPDLFATP